MTLTYSLKSLLLKPFIAVESGASWASVKDSSDVIWVSSQSWDTDLIAIRKARRIESDLALYSFRNSRFTRSLLAQKLLSQRASGDVQVRPISIFWGRASSSGQSVWRTMFQEGWRLPSRFGRAFKVLVNIRRAFCATADVVTIGQQPELDDQVWLQQVHEQLDAMFKGEREAVIGPDYSHRRVLAEQVLADSRVTNEIDRQVELGGDRRKLEVKAQKYLFEMAADYSNAMVRVLEILLNWVWGRIYAGVKSYGVDRVRSVAGTHEVVYVPCHRSHIDYLLLSFGIYREGLMPPHIAAGINLNLPVVGSMLRRAGAFFIRRRIAGNKLYAQVLEAYLSEMCFKGYPLEYFIEGGRSRTGMLLQPKAGMLAMTLRSSAVKPGKPLAFVPVYFGYDKIIESHAYIEEMYGRAKKAESIGQLFKSLRILRYNYGSVQVNFGEPIFEEALDGRFGDVKPDDRERTGFLANTIMQSINKNAVISSANLVATALLSPQKRSMLESELSVYLEMLRAVAKVYSPEVIDAEKGSEEIIAHSEALGLILRNPHELGDVLYLDQEGAAHSTFLRNNTLHLYIIPSLISRTVMTRSRISRQRLKRLIATIYPYVATELFLPWTAEQVDEIVDRYCDVLIECGLLQEGARYLEPGSEHENIRYYLSFMANLSDGILERFYLVAKILLAAEGRQFDMGSMVERCVIVAKRISLLHAFHQPDFFDKGLFKAFLSALFDQQVLSLNEGVLKIDSRLRIATRQAWFMMDEEVLFAARATIQALESVIEAPADDSEKVSNEPNG